MQNQVSLEDNRIFVICTPDPKRAESMSRFVQTHINKAKIYIANNGSEAQFKVANAPPHVLIVDLELPKMSSEQLIKSLLEDPNNQHMAFIIMSPIPDQEFLVDLIVTGQVQFVYNRENQDATLKRINKALNFVSSGEDNQYHVRFVSSGETLITEGDLPESVYILREGRMVALKCTASHDVVLGYIEPGEFVGEMARFMKEKRSATVKAMTDCELIEIPDDTLDTVLFSKPSWAKALFQTLSRRIKQSNERILENS
ncbi:MAG: cyclic nucleotide-binding domain-containing protein [Bdellovibrionales bacterium]